MTLCRHTTLNPASLLCVLAGASLLVSGCGKPESSAENGRADPHAGSEAVSTSTVHSHDNPEETCFICDPTKRDKGRLWCKEHGRYEDRCWLCHPELEDTSRLFCGEHGLYEDECFFCRPEIKSDGASTRHDPAATDEGRTASDALYCNEHDVPEAECAICQPDLAAALEPGESMKVRFPSLEAARKAGVRATEPGFVEAAPGVKAYCEVQFNLNRTARITPLAGGIIHEVRHDVGTAVSEGDVLVVLHSAAVAEAKSEYLTALVEHDIRRQTYEREQRLQEQKISAERELLDAEAAYRTSRLKLSNLRQKLLNLDFTEEEIVRIETSQDASADLHVRAPFDGSLVERSAVVGESVEAGYALFTITDLSTHWLNLSVPTAEVERVRLGQGVEARFAEFPDVIYTGRITWVDEAVDPRTRMVRARALVSNAGGCIKTGLFGEARILTGDMRPAAVLPRDAVQLHEGRAFVFVPAEPDLFALRRVTPGRTIGHNIHILAGLNRGDSVVTDGSFIVMSEFLKSRLGAGCVHE